MAKKTTKPRSLKAARSWGKMGFVALVSGAIGEAHPELVHGAQDYMGKLGEQFGEEYHRAKGSWAPEDFRDFCLRRLVEVHPITPQVGA